MLADDVLPQVFLDDVLVSRGDEPDHKEAHDGKEQVQPIFVEHVDVAQGFGGFVLVLMVMFQQTERQGDDEDHHTQQQGDTLGTGVF